VWVGGDTRTTIVGQVSLGDSAADAGSTAG
jgi:hypothetical protein